MGIEITLFIYFIFVHISFTMGAIPGTFFWKPRLGLDLTVPSATEKVLPPKPTVDNMRDGKVVVIEGYQTGLTVLALSAAYSAGTNEYHLNPMSPHFYTDSYRWALRHFNLLPLWISGTGGNYCETHKLWRRRFLRMDAFVPDWIKKTLFFVKKEDWEKEEKEFKLYQRFAEPAFGRYYRYPSIKCSMTMRPGKKQVQLTITGRQDRK